MKGTFGKCKDPQQLIIYEKFSISQLVGTIWPSSISRSPVVSHIPYTRITIWYTTCSKGFPSILLTTFEPEILRIDKSRKGGANRRSSPIQINNFSFEVGWCHEVWVFPSIDGGVKMSFSPILFEVQSPSTDHAKQNNVGSSSGLPSPQQNYRTRSDVDSILVNYGNFSCDITLRGISLKCP